MQRNIKISKISSSDLGKIIPGIKLIWYFVLCRHTSRIKCLWKIIKAWANLIIKVCSALPSNITTLCSASCRFQLSKWHKHVVSFRACWTKKGSSGTIQNTVKLTHWSRLGLKQIRTTSFMWLTMRHFYCDVVWTLLLWCSLKLSISEFCSFQGSSKEWCHRAKS